MMEHNHLRLLSLLLCMAMIVSVLPGAVLAADGHAYENGICTGCGEYEPAVLEDGRYTIGNAGQLYWFAAQVNAGNSDLDAKLTADITVNTDVLDDEGDPNTGDFLSWSPIGSSKDVAYTGSFDGNGKVVSGLYLKDGDRSYVGVFGYVDHGTVTDLGIVDSYLLGHDHVGGIVGAGDFAQIGNCFSSASVSAGSSVGGVVGNCYMGTVRDCIHTGTVTGGSYVGGVLGTGAGYDLDRCGNSGTVTGSGSWIGGIAGSANNEATLRSCYDLDAVSGNDYVGGLVGSLGTDSTLTGSYSIGSVTGDASRVGALVGHLTSGTGQVSDCYYLDGGDDATGSQGLEAEVFASGALAYRLNGSTDQGDLIWFQTIGTDPAPLLSGDTVYLATAPCPTYSNEEGVSVKEHTGPGATCTEDAWCEVCGQMYQAALGHDYQSVVTPPTCTEDGFTTHTCTGCGDSYTDTPVPATGHSWKDATCTDPQTCTVCGATEGEALGHTYKTETVSNTCTEDGSATHTCTVCGHSYTEVIPADHTWIEATCTEPRTCAVCGLTEAEAPGHSYKAVVTDPTCTADGYTTHTCERCGDSYTDTPVPATGHSWRAATCSAPKTCAYCGKTEGEVLSHSYDKVVTAPTCTEAGYTTYTCTLCGHTYNGSYTDAKGHDYTAEVTAPTCLEAGCTTYTCTACGHTYTDGYTNALGHDYQDGICANCGDVQLGKPTIVSCYSKHQTSVKITWTPVENADGYRLWRSTDPEDHSTWIIAKTIHDGTADRYTNQGLTEGVTYYYSVQAYILDDDGNKVWSDYSDMSYMPAAVVFDGPYSNATFRIRLRWQEVGGAHGYQIWRQNADGSFSIAKTIGDRGSVLTNDQGGTTAYSNTGLTAGESYTYKMRSFTITEDGRKIFGAFSDEVTVAVMPEIPAVTVTSPKAERAKVAWDSVNGAAGYQIWISDSRNGTYKIAKSVTDPAATSATLYGLDSGKTYYVKVRAYTDVDGKKTFGGYSDPIAIQIK